MSNNHDSEIVRRLRMYFPSIAKSAVDIIQTSDYDLLIRMNDGASICYDDIHNTIRTLPEDCNNLTEDQCRTEFGVRLRQMMSRKGISEVELSEAAGISNVQLSRYISGKTSPSFYNVDKIAKALDCSVDELRYV